MINLFNWVDKLVGYFTFNFGGGGGGGTQTSTGTTYTSNIPEYAKPFFEEAMKQSAKEVFTTDPSGNVTGIKPVAPYTGERIVGFTPEQAAIQQQFAGLQTPGQFAQAGQGLGASQAAGLITSQAGLNKALGYNPSVVSSQNTAAPNLMNYQMSGTGNIIVPTLQQYAMQGATTAGAGDINVPSLQQYGMDAAQLAYNPNLTQYQMGPAQNVAASNIATQNFGQSAANTYMSPYIQAAINPALREARLQGDLQKQAGMTGAIGRGTFGGARQALLQAEQERGTQRTMSDIQATGMEKAYQNAQAQFQADQARQLQAQQANQQYGLQAQLANQQAGLTTGQQNLAAKLGVQQLGTQSSLQAQLANLTNAQQANVQNLASKLQTQGLSADQALKAALANQQTRQQTALANLTNEQQANVQNLAAKLQTQGLNADQALKAALANQQTQQTTQQQNLAALLGVQQLGAGQSLEAQKANQAAALQAAQLTQQGQQYAAGLGKDVGLAGLATALEGSKALGTLGAAEQQANLQRLQAQATTAKEKQALQQQINDLEYQKFMEQQNRAKQQLEFYNAMLRGTPGLASTQIQYAPQPSAISQLGGLGLGALGLSKAFG